MAEPAKRVESSGATDLKSLKDQTFDVVHITRYRRQRNLQKGATVVDLNLGVVKDRKFTDPVFIILFVLVVAGMCFVASRSFSKGNPWMLIYGADSFGNICRLKRAKIPKVPLSGRDLREDTRLFVMAEGIEICIPRCVDRLIAEVEELIQYKDEENINLCLYNVTTEMITSYFTETENTTGEILCPELPVFPEKSVFNRCFRDPDKLPGDQQEKDDNLTETVDCQAEDFFMTTALDVHGSLVDIIILFVIAVGLSAFMLFFIGYATKPAVWIVFISPFLICLGAAAFCWLRFSKTHSSKSRSPNATKPTTWAVLGSLAIVLLIIVGVVLIVLARKVYLVIPVFKEAGRSLRSIPMLLVLPFLVMLVMIGVVAIFIWLFMYMQSAFNYEPTPEETAAKSLDRVLSVFRWIYLLCLFWVVLVFFECEKFIVISAVCDWYFTRNKDTFEHGVSRAVVRLLTRHLGSVLFGSLVLNLALEIYQTLMKFIRRKTEHKRTTSALCLNDFCSCCLSLYDKPLKYLDSSAYAMIAIYGCTFIDGCRKAFAVSVGVGKQLEYVCFICALVIFLGKLGVVALQFIISFNLVEMNKEICRILVPIAISVVWTIITIHCFLCPYTAALEAMFICYCEDTVINDGEEKPYLMSEQLKEFLIRDKEEQAKMLERQANITAQSTAANPSQAANQNLPKSQPNKRNPEAMTRY